MGLYDCQLCPTLRGFYWSGNNTHFKQFIHSEHGKYLKIVAVKCFRGQIFFFLSGEFLHWTLKKKNLQAESTLYCFVHFNRHLRKLMNRPLPFHREHTLFTQNTLGNPVQCQISFQLKATEAWPSNFLAFNSFYYIFFPLSGPNPPLYSSHFKTPFLTTPMTPHVQTWGQAPKITERSQTRGKERVREGGRQREGEKPKILLPCPNRAKNPKPSHKLGTTSSPPPPTQPRPQPSCV